MSDLGMAGFEGYHRNDEDRIQTRKDLKNYFIQIFEHEPTEKQLEIFLNVLIGREKDIDKALDFCEINEIENINEKI